ncbi:MAG: zinc-dependent alcohol dehydrogenase family protein [Psychrobium sp.]|nr:zinc-dependent alcohol dehydrogenase family protein [Psychrobium sp.]
MNDLVVVFDQLGDPSVLGLVSMPAPIPIDSQVLVEVLSFSLNRADCLFIRGHHYSVPQLPSRVGSEMAGIVRAVGPKVTRFKVGDKVSSLPFDNKNYGVQGSWAILPQQYLVTWPAELNSQQACAVWMQYLTAYFALNVVGKIDKNSWVFIPAASSSAGLGAIAIAKLIGCHVIAASRGNSKKIQLEQCGVDYIVDTQADDLAEQLLAITEGDGIDFVYDPIGGQFHNKYLDALAVNAKVLIYGLLSGEETVIDLVKMVRKNATIYPYSMFNFVTQPKLLKLAIDFIGESIEQGKLRPVIDSVWTLQEVVKAYQYMESNRQFGKVVVTL